MELESVYYTCRRARAAHDPREAERKSRSITAALSAAGKLVAGFYTAHEGGRALEAGGIPASPYIFRVF